MTQSKSAEHTNPPDTNSTEVGGGWIQSLGAISAPSSINEGYQAWMQALSNEPVKLAQMQQHFVEEQKRLFDLSRRGRDFIRAENRQDVQHNSASARLNPVSASGLRQMSHPGLAGRQSAK